MAQLILPSFVVAAREMREWIEAWNPSDIEQSLAQKLIKWKFNPQVLRILEVFGSDWSEAARKLGWQ